MTKKMTIEKLAEMTQIGFEGLEKKINKRFDGVDKRFGQIDENIDHIKNVLIGKHDNEIEKINDRLRKVETTQGI